MTESQKEELNKKFKEHFGIDESQNVALVNSQAAFDWFLSIIEEREKLLREKIEAADKLYDGLEDAITGLTWTMETHPENVDKADYEEIEEWQAALEHYKALKV